MKKITKFFMAALMVATVGFIACSKDDDKKTDNSETYTESASYAIYYQGAALTAGQTINCTPTAAQIELQDAEVDIYMFNKTESTLNTCFKVELTEGPDTMKQMPVCYGVCETHQSPYTHEAIALAPGMDSKPIQVHVYMDMHNTNTGTYKITVGEGENLANPQVCFVKFTW